MRREVAPAKDPVTVIPNGIDPVDARRREVPGLRILSLARLSPEKRLPALVDGFAELHADPSGGAA